MCLGESNGEELIRQYQIGSKQEYGDNKVGADYDHETSGWMAFEGNANYDNNDDDDDGSTTDENPMDGPNQAGNDIEASVKFNREVAFTGITVNMNAAKIPDGSHQVDKIGSSVLNESVRETVRHIHEILERRPIMTVRVIKGQLQLRLQSDLQEALPFCGYMFTNGPWKKALIKFGVDPRIRPDFRFYQTVSFRMEFDPVVEPGKHDWIKKGVLAFPQLLEGNDNVSYIFNGKKIVADGDTWQICDITDLLLQSILSTEQLRTKISSQDGFFCNGTMAKLETIMQDKIVCIRDGTDCDDNEYNCLLAFPDKYEPLCGRDYISYGLDFGQRYTRKQAFLRGRLINRARKSHQ
ncbi:general transcription factor 3C polypeptide 5 [Aspergillus niger]|nr:general transcription factor 3C polypeptide 5 [Aspergillus niger]